MKDQINTIREALEKMGETRWPATLQTALTALDQLEAMVGEPFGHYVYFPDQQRGEFVHDLDDLCEDMTNDENHEVTSLYAAPVAQQYEAGDMADAQAKAFRAGVASVTQQEPVHWRAVLDPAQSPQQLKTAMHVVGFREKKAAEGFVAEQIDFYGWRYTIEPLYAVPVAQHATFDAQRALEAIEALLSNIRRDAPSLSGKAMGFAEEVAAALRDKVAQQPQAEAVLVVDRVYEAAKRLVDHADFQLGGVLSAKSKTRDIPSNAASKVKARHLASLRDALAKTSQQAEAVPSDVVRDAERYRWLRSKSHYQYTRAWIGGHSTKKNSDVDFLSLDEALGAIDASIDAAIAQQKGGV